MTPRLSLALVVGINLAACGGGGSEDPDAVPMTVCTNGLDDDGDGSTDYPADPGCASAADTDEGNPPIAMCADSRDNDGDTFIDFPNDPGCLSPLQNSEADDCPTGDDCPACANDLDDNGDGQIDFPEDDGCSSAADNDEYATDPDACGAGVTVTRLMTQTATGTLPAAPSNVTSTECGGGGGEVPYEIIVTEPSVLVATTRFPETTVDTVLYVRTQCLVEATELACNDNIPGAPVLASELTVNLAPGLYYLVVDARTLGSGGPFKLEVQLFAGEGTECADQSECGPGLQCRTPIGGSTMICTTPVCSDGVDDDGDTLDDYPDDPGCTDGGDFDEADDCPDGPTCPACGNGVDDDGDGDIDYPADVDCLSAAQPVEGCSVEDDPIATQGGPSSTGTTTGATNDFFPSCDFSSGGPDIVTLVTVPDMSMLHVDLSGTTFDAVLAIHDQSCENEIACQDTFVSGGEVIELPDLAAGTYAVVVDGYFGANGPYTVNVSGIIAPFGDCTGPLVGAGAIDCGPGYACTGGICLGNLQCNNGTDDDGDGDIDYPNDPGCAGPNDTTESDDCPAGPECPACSNSVDDDGDGDTDYPADADCLSAADDDENPPACTQETDPVQPITGGTTTGSTSGLTNDFEPSCGFGFGWGPDKVYALELPAMQNLHLDGFGSTFTVLLGLYNPACDAELGCSFGGGSLDFTNTPAGTYNVLLDGYDGQSGNYNVHVSGTIAPLGACDGILASSGAIACPTGYNCTGGVCLGTAQCNNGSDDDGDGKQDYPVDPGCGTPTDTTETDNCPSGPGCPQCGNGLDDDGDGEIDYPNDASCLAAGGTSEGTCGQDAGGVTPVVIPLYSGTTIGGGNDFTPTCGTNAPAQDRAFALTLPIDVTRLHVDTIGSTFDTVLSVMDSSCTGVLACDDQSGGAFGASSLDMTNVPAGQYGIIVDGWTGDGDYMLNVRGTAAAGAACTHPLFSTGVLVCPANHICTAGTCQPL